MKEKKIAVCIILSIITCGIYAIYWMYTISEDMILVNDKYRFSGTKVVILTCATIGLYGIYWSFKIGDSIFLEGRRRNIKTYSSSIKCLIFYILGVVISLAFMQSDINDMAQKSCS